MQPLADVREAVVLAVILLAGRSPGHCQFAVNSDLVVLHATVVDRQGRRVSGLQRGDFRVEEDGEPQQIALFTSEDIPIAAGLLVDNSTSMATKKEAVIAGALAFARASNPQDQVFVILFSDKVSMGLPPATPFTSSIPQLEEALTRIAPSGKTALYDAIGAGLEYLKRGDRDKKVLIIISDGGDNVSRRNLTQTVLAAEQSDTIIYTIGVFDDLDHDRNPKVLERLAVQTGGSPYLPRTTNDVTGICQRIAKDIRSQYTLGYVPTNQSEDGTYRRIHVTASTPNRGKLFVRTRIGYVAPLSPKRQQP